MTITSVTLSGSKQSVTLSVSKQDAQCVIAKFEDGKYTYDAKDGWAAKDVFERIEGHRGTNGDAYPIAQLMCQLAGV